MMAERNSVVTSPEDSYTERVETRINAIWTRPNTPEAAGLQKRYQVQKSHILRSLARIYHV